VKKAAANATQFASAFSFMLLIHVQLQLPAARAQSKTIAFSKLAS